MPEPHDRPDLGSQPDLGVQPDLDVQPETGLQPEPHDQPFDVWGDETEIVKMSMEWASRRVVRPSDPKSTARPASELAAAAGVMISPSGIGAEAALRIFDEVLVPATRAQDDPMNLAYIPAAPTRAAIAFESVASSANVFAGLWEAGAGAIFAENAALAWLVELLGWPTTAGGCFVSGGTIGNLSALVAARQAALARRSTSDRNSLDDGRQRSHRWRLACTAGAHSSIRSAAEVLDAEVVLVEEDARGHLTGAALRTAIERSGEVFAVVASAGTTNTGVVDDLDDIADVCAEFGIWLHVDGAYGGAALVAPSARPRFRGIERADSFIVDPHKWLFAPYDCCALLYRDPRLARAAHSQRASYLDVVDREEWNPADLAVHLSRRARGLPFWFSLATYGTDRYRDAVEHTLSTARAVAAEIRASAQLRLVREPELSVLLFERPGWGPDDYAVWSRRLAHEGVMLCLPTLWQGRTVLRMAFVNPATRADHVIKVLTETTLESPQ